MVSGVQVSGIFDIWVSGGMGQASQSSSPEGLKNDSLAEDNSTAGQPEKIRSALSEKQICILFF